MKTDVSLLSLQACEHLRSFIDDCDRRTELAKKRLAETQEELSAEVNGKAEKVHQLAEEIGKKLAMAEQTGAEGKVEESMKLMEEVEDIRKKKASAEQEYRNSMPASSYQQQKLRVCEVCSAYLGIHDNDRRLADHFGGKLHLGFIKIREKLSGLMTNFEERRAKRREARMRDSPDMDRGGRRGFERDRGGFGGGGGGGFGGGGGGFYGSGANAVGLGDKPSRDREDRDRGSRRDRSRSRSRDRDRRRRRSRSRSRDRRRRSRSRSRDRSSRHHKSSSRRHRSRSREDRKRRRSRSRSRSRRRSRERRSKSSDRFRDSPPPSNG